MVSWWRAAKHPLISPSDAPQRKDSEKVVSALLRPMYSRGVSRKLKAPAQRRAAANPQRGRRENPMQENLNPFAIAQQQFDRAADMLDLDAGSREVLRRPKRALVVSVPIKMDNGNVRVFEGYRVQHNIARGPAKGGIRFHPNVTL